MGVEPPRDGIGASMVTDVYCTKNKAMNGRVDNMFDVGSDCGCW